MSGGSLTGIRKETGSAGTNVSQETVDYGAFYGSPAVGRRVLVQERKKEINYGYYGIKNIWRGSEGDYNTISTTKVNWDEIIAEVNQMESEDLAESVWDSDKMQSLLSAPIGSPVELSREEANEIVQLAFGRRRDLPPGAQYVGDVRELLGHSLLERLKDADKE